MERFICIHGHFYQPPRENPWLEAVELQDSAYPYHDWNERITAECYAPNTAARILDGDGRIVNIVNNYSRISFNFGPTLLAWLERLRPEIYQAVLDADTASRDRFSGHGSAVAQAYNHMILPLANRRDKRTQILWGLADFRHRFGRDAEGMWLPETAVDLESLDILAERGVRFTVLAPRQAAKVRGSGERRWRDVSGGRIDPTTAYRLRLPSGRSIAIFFYDGPISRGVAFERLLERGENLAGRLLGAFNDARAWPQLVHVATDGETYGHHQHHGDMALAYALHHIETNGLATLTNYGEYLARHPPAHEVRIVENTSWSCAHGIERWRSDCGCSSGTRPGWRQHWRQPLRAAFDWLRDALAPRFEARAGALLLDPWQARDALVEVVLDRSPAAIDAFLSRHASRKLREPQVIDALKLLEMQRHLMLMYTSCGWFFDELSGIETVQVMAYAGRAVQLAREAAGENLESEFLERLAQARSNLPEMGDGRDIYRRFVGPAAVDLDKVGAHFAVSSVFEEYGERERIYCYTVEKESFERGEVGRSALALGTVRITSEITRESGFFTFGVVHFGDHNLRGGVRPFQGEQQYRSLADDVRQAFDRADTPEALRRLERHLGTPTYSLRSLFRDEQRKVLGRLLEATLAEVEESYRRVYRESAPLLLFLSDLGVPGPRAFQIAAELVLNAEIRRALEADEPDLERAAAALGEARARHVALDGAGLGFTLGRALERLARRLQDDRSGELLELLADASALVGTPGFEVNLWETQNLFYAVVEEEVPVLNERIQGGDGGAAARLDLLAGLGGRLGVRVG
jgi:alpha-amylase/alpha-mannosidase (GH57 family)